jgi:hypoxanthine phosphoribosyltransferase
MALRPLYDSARIAGRIAALGATIAHDWADRAPVLLVLMDGAFVFAADLARAIPSPGLRLHFVSAKSYAGTASTGTVRLGATPDLAGHEVLIVDDILDTGRTLAAARDAALAAGAVRVRTCVLLDKPDRRVPGGLAQADYVGFTIPDAFVVGFGLDHDGRYRHLPEICVLET